MNEHNYLVVEVYPSGSTRVIAQVYALDDALLLLGQLVSRYYDPHNLFAIRTICVTGSESINRYQLEECWNKNNEEEKENG